MACVIFKILGAVGLIAGRLCFARTVALVFLRVIGVGLGLICGNGGKAKGDDRGKREECSFHVLVCPMPTGGMVIRRWLNQRPLFIQTPSDIRANPRCTLTRFPGAWPAAVFMQHIAEANRGLVQNEDRLH
jgi:hypothetical protein